MWMTSPVYSCGERTSTSGLPACMCASTSSRKARMREVGLLRGVGSRRVAWHVAGVRAALGLPLGPAAVHQAAILMAVHLEEPVGVGGVPVVAVAVEDDGRVVGDAALRHQLLELFLSDEVADELALLVGVPVELDRAGDVADFVEQHILIGFDDAHLADRPGVPRPTRSRRGHPDWRSRSPLGSPDLAPLSSLLLRASHHSIVSKLRGYPQGTLRAADRGRSVQR